MLCIILLDAMPSKHGDVRRAKHAAGCTTQKASNSHTLGRYWGDEDMPIYRALTYSILYY